MPENCSGDPSARARSLMAFSLRSSGVPLPASAEARINVRGTPRAWRSPQRLASRDTFNRPWPSPGAHRSSSSHHATGPRPSSANGSGSGAEHPGQPTAATLSPIGRATKPLSRATSSSPAQQATPVPKGLCLGELPLPIQRRLDAVAPPRTDTARSLRCGRPRTDNVRLTSRRTIARVVHIG